ncbi:phosphohydrolase [Halosolutus gelatinilyticus]
MPEVTVSESLYKKLEEQTEESIEDAVWELMYQARRETQY